MHPETFEIKLEPHLIENEISSEEIEEKRLVGTIMTGKPSLKAFMVATFTIVIMMLSTLFYWRAPEAWSDLLPAVNSQIFQHAQWWRVFTAIFIHADLEHFLSNMYMLWIFTFFVFGYFGFSLFPMLSLVSATLINAIAVKTYAPEIELLGASGLVYVLGGCWLTLYLMIQRQYTFVSRLVRVVGIAFIIFWPTTFVATTSYRTHGLGFIAGVIMGLIYFYRNKKAIQEREIYL